MNAVADSDAVRREVPPVRAPRVQRRVFAATIGILMLIGAAAGLNDTTGRSGSEASAAFIVLSAFVTMIAQCRQLSVQNVLLASGVTVGIAVPTEFAWLRLNGSAGNPPFGVWLLPILWVTALLNSRGVAQLVLRGRQGSARYGLEMLALTIVLFDVLLFATRFFAVPAAAFNFHLARQMSLILQIAGWSLAAFVILLLATPAMINKKPVQFPPNYQPVLLWIQFMLIAAAGACLRNSWVPAAAEFASTLALVFLVFRGAARLAA